MAPEQVRGQRADHRSAVSRLGGFVTDKLFSAAERHCLKSAVQFTTT